MQFTTFRATAVHDLGVRSRVLPPEGHHVVPGASIDQVVGMVELMQLPAPRGPLGEALEPRPGHPDHPVRRDHRVRRPGGSDLATCALTDEDLQLSLAVCYELHYRGFDGVDDDWEWDPAPAPAPRRAQAPGTSQRCGTLVGTVAVTEDEPIDRQLAALHRGGRRTVAVDATGQDRHPSRSGGST